MTQELILCAALHLDDGKHYASQPENIITGFVVLGRRHEDCYDTISIICRISGGSAMKFDIDSAMRGFISSNGYFYDRKEAFRIALQAGQVRNSNLIRGSGVYELTSDHLY